jgi:hypothetical protein
MTSKKSETSLSKKEQTLLKENALLKSKLGFALGVLETVQILIRPVSQEILDKNLEHLRTNIPRSLEDLRKGI